MTRPAPGLERAARLAALLAARSEEEAALRQKKVVALVGKINERYGDGSKRRQYVGRQNLAAWVSERHSPWWTRLAREASVIPPSARTITAVIAWLDLEASEREKARREAPSDPFEGIREADTIETPRPARSSR